MPIGLAASQEGDSVTLAWDANVEPDLMGYKVYWGVASRTYGTPVEVLLTSLTNPNSPSYTVTGLANGTWYFAVTAYNTAGLESGYSNEVWTTVSVGPAPPTGLYIVEPIAFDMTGTTVRIAWKSKDPATSRIEYTYDMGVHRSQPVSTVAVTDHYIRLTDLTPGTVYRYEVACELTDGKIVRASGTFKTW